MRLYPRQCGGDGIWFFFILRLLREILFEDDHLTFAGYSVPHPLTRSAQFIVRTDGKAKAINVFRKAAKKLINRTEELRSEFQKALKAA